MNNIEEPVKDKTSKLKHVIGVILFFVLIVGATYAYFGIETLNTTTERLMNSTVEEKFAVAVSGSLTMEMDLKTNQMKAADSDITYYVSTEGATTRETEEAFATLSTAWEEDLTCAFKIHVENIAADGFLNTVSQIFNYGVTNEMVLELKNGTELISAIDMKTAVWTDNAIIIDTSVSGLINGTDKILTAKLYLNMFENINQNYLSNTKTSFSIYIDNVNCYRTSRSQ